MAEASAEIKLVIFDCDGVLVDSEPLAMRVLLKLIAAHGVQIDPAIGFRDFLGKSLQTITQHLNVTYGLQLGADALDAMRAELYAVFNAELKATRWLVETLVKLDLPICVASSSQLERIRLSLDLTGLSQHFEPHIFSASMVARGKPDPDLFIHAAAAMGVEPRHCLVIEDSPAGITAAKAAGMRVFAYAGGKHIIDNGLRPDIAALGADAIIDDMRALPGLIALHQARADAQADLLLAVDVGTASARAALVDHAGQMLARAESPLELRRRDASHAEYSSEQVWSAVCQAVRSATAAAGARPEEIRGISFDATCSLVVRDQAGIPLPVAADGDSAWDTIAWFDHRALAEAQECTDTGHTVLDSLGGVMSPEMQVPKLMWLKRHLPQTWARSGYFFDLVDFLTWKSSGSLARSQCTLTSKWTYLGHSDGWQQDFLQAVGVGDLLLRGALPDQAGPIGQDLGCLTAAAANDLGATTACRVGLGLIDAHAGALGALAAFVDDVATIDQHLALIAGTSSCIMAMSSNERPMAGIWGPYRDVILPGAWVTEAGQSATGALLDHIIRWHGAGGEPTAARHRAIGERINELRAGQGLDFARRLHVLPDFHGNRSPLADPNARGVISGLTLDDDFDSLCRLYWRTAVGIALGIRHMLETLNGQGFAIDTLHVTGGHLRSPLLMELYADATGCTVVEPSTMDATLLGTAIVAATAAGLYPSLASAANAMQQGGTKRLPAPAAQARFDQDYRIFLEMLRHRDIVDAMEEWRGPEAAP